MINNKGDNVSTWKMHLLMLIRPYFLFHNTNSIFYYFVIFMINIVMLLLTSFASKHLMIPVFGNESNIFLHRSYVNVFFSFSDCPKSFYHLAVIFVPQVLYLDLDIFYLTLIIFINNLICQTYLLYFPLLFYMLFSSK